MRHVNIVVNSLCDLLFLPFAGRGPWPGMIAVACVTAALFVWVFRACSDQSALKRQKGRMLARALELLVFRHDMAVSLTAFGRIAAANGGYFKELLKPLAVAIIPSVLLLIQLACWYEHRPFAVGEPVLVSVDLNAGQSVLDGDVSLTPSSGLELETEGLRIPSLNQMNWRLRTRTAGSAWVGVSTGDVSLRKEVVCGKGMRKMCERRVRAGFWNELVHPCEPPVPRENPVEQIRVRYPHRQILIAGYDVPWVVVFLVLTMAFGLVFGRLMRVSF